jgi:hypothetical protein
LGDHFVAHQIGEAQTRGIGGVDNHPLVADAATGRVDGGERRSHHHHHRRRALHVVVETCTPDRRTWVNAVPRFSIGVVNTERPRTRIRIGYSRLPGRVRALLLASLSPGGCCVGAPRGHGLLGGDEVWRGDTGPGGFR